MRKIVFASLIVGAVGAVVACGASSTPTLKDDDDTTNTRSARCGDNKLDPGEECDSDTGCYSNCTCIDKTKDCPAPNAGTSTPGVDGSTTTPTADGSADDSGSNPTADSGGGNDSGSTTTDSGANEGGTLPQCVGKTVYAGKVGPKRSDWGNGTALSGLAAGNSFCSTAFPNSHVCVFEEFVRARSRSEVPNEANATLWVHRTGAVTYKGTTYPADVQGGGHCEDWTYQTNHRANGEWYDMNPATAEESRFHLDTQPFFNANGDGTFTEPGLPCGAANGTTGRFIPCCFTVPAECN